MRVFLRSHREANLKILAAAAGFIHSAATGIAPSAATGIPPSDDLFSIKTKEVG